MSNPIAPRVAVALIALVIARSPVVAAEPEVMHNLLALPSSQAAVAILEGQSRFSWDQQPLRDGLRNLGRTHGLTIWIDRRIDPNQRITTAGVETSNPPDTLWDCLRQVARLSGGELGLIENVVYLGPPGDVARLERAAAVLYDRLGRRRSAGRDATPGERRPLQWAELITPTELIKQIEDDWQLPPIEVDLPHDLWHAGEFTQPSTLATQLTVVLGGFGMEIAIDGDRIRGIPLDSDTRWRATYRAAALRGGHWRSSDVTAWRREHPDGQLRQRAGTLFASGDASAHRALFSPQRSRGAGRATTELWSLQVANTPVAGLMDNLAREIGLTIAWDAACTPDQRQRLVSFRVVDQTLDHMLAEIAAAAELDIVREGTRVTIRPRAAIQPPSGRVEP